MVDALSAFERRRWERCRMVVENSLRLAEIEIQNGDKDEHAQVMQRDGDDAGGSRVKAQAAEIRTLTRAHIAALMVAHCAGMIDLVSLPVWVGTLISKYRFDAQEAGGLATLFLLSAVAASLGLAPRVTRLRARLVATAGFVRLRHSPSRPSRSPRATRSSVPCMPSRRAGVGAALSVTHGAIGRSGRPHRLFAIAGLSLGVTGIIFLGVTPPLVEAFGGAVLFRLFAGDHARGRRRLDLRVPGDRSPRGRKTDTRLEGCLVRSGGASSA